MDLARFHRAIDVIDSECSSTGVIQHINSLIDNLNQLASNPGNAEISKNFKQQLDDLRAALLSSSLNDSDDTTLTQVVRDLGLADYLGEGLFDSIKTTIESNQLSPNLASAALSRLRDSVNEKLSQLASIKTAFKSLSVSYFELPAGDAEMLIDLPVEPASRTLDDLAKESKDWNLICKAISETFDPELKPVAVRTIASGSWLLYLAGTPLFIAGVARCLKGVNSILTELIKMKSLYAQLTESKAPEEVLQKLEEHNSTKVKTDLNELANRLVDEYYKGGDDGRKNELRNALSQALTKLSRKLADGTKVQLRLTLPKRPHVDEGQEPTVEQRQQLDALAEAERIKLEVDQAKPQLNFDEHQEALKALPPPNAE